MISVIEYETLYQKFLTNVRLFPYMNSGVIFLFLRQ